MNSTQTLRRGAIAAACTLAVAVCVAPSASAEGEESYVLRGRVVAAATHTPLRGVCVRVESTDSWSWAELSRTTRSSSKVVSIERKAAQRGDRYGDADDCLDGVYTDAGGAYALTVPAWTMGDVTATDFGGTYVRAVVGPANGEPGTEVSGGDTAMSVGATISGVALDAVTGEPVAGACPSAVRNVGAASTGEMSIAVVQCSGSDGRWALTGLAQGRYRVALSAPGYDVRFAPGGTSPKTATVYRAVGGASLQTGPVELPTD